MKKVVVCQVEGIEPQVLTRWRFYEVLAEDTAPTPVICVQADDGSERWFPAILFAPYPTEPPQMLQWRFDEPFEDLGEDYNTVSLDMSDGTRRWCNVVTLGWLQHRLSDPQQRHGIRVGQTLIVPALAPEHIEATLRRLEDYKELTDATTLLPSPGDPMEEPTE
jgi:hypothetical protein